MTIEDLGLIFLLGVPIAWIAWNAALVLYNTAMIAAEWLARKVRREI